MRMWIFFVAVCVCGLFARMGTAGEAAVEPLTLEAGPIWNNEHAKERCPEVLAEWLANHPGREARWTGHWNTTVLGEMSVCRCEAVVDAEKTEANEVVLKNFTPAAIVGAAVTAGGVVAATRENDYVLPKQAVPLKVDAGEKITSIAVDLGLMKVRFADLSALPSNTDLALGLRMEGDDEVFLEWTDAEGVERRISGEVTLLVKKEDPLHDLKFDAALAADSIAAIRRAAPDSVCMVDNRLGLWMDFAEDDWYAFITPDQKDADDRESRPASIHLISPSHFVALDDTFLKIRELGFRPLRAWVRVHLAEDQIVNLFSFKEYLYGTEKLDHEDIDSVWSEVMREAVSDDIPDGGGWMLQILFVTNATFEEVRDEKPLEARPIFLLQRDAGVLLNLRYYVDGRSLIENAFK